MKTETELKTGLANFYGSETFTRWSPLTKSVATEGVMWLAEHAECFWLLDLIASHQLDPRVRSEDFQVWKLTGTPGGKATVVCEDGDGNEITRQELEFSTFPLDAITLYAGLNEHGSRTVILTTEY